MPFPLKFALKVTHPRLKNAKFNLYLLITSEQEELEKNVQLSRIESRPLAFQRAMDEVRMLPLTPPKGALPLGVTGTVISPQQPKWACPCSGCLFYGSPFC